MRGVLVFSVLAVACAATTQPANVELSGTSIGPVRFGMTASDIAELGLPTHRDQVSLEGDAYDRITVTVGDGEAIVIILQGDRVGDIETASSVFETANGASVGDTLSELRALYPTGEVNIGREEGGYFNFETPEHGFFELDRTGVPESCFDYNGECPDLGAQRSTSYRIRDVS